MLVNKPNLIACYLVSYKENFMNTITLAPSWELLKKSDEDTKNLNPRNTQQWMDFYNLSNWNVST